MASWVKAKISLLRQKAEQFADDEEGATAIEYGLIVALIFLAVVGAIKQFSNSTSDMYSEISEAVTNP